MHHAFWYISLLSTARLPVKIPNFTFCVSVNKQWQKSFSWTWIWLIEIQLQKSSLALDKVSELKLEYNRWKNVNSLFHTTFSWLSAIVVSFKNSLIFMQNLTDARVNTCNVSSSLYFWKSVFSFRADNILKSDGDFISNWSVSLLTACISLVHEPLDVKPWSRQ